MRPYRHLRLPAGPPADHRDVVVSGWSRRPIDLAFDAMIGPAVLRLAVQGRA